MSGEEPQTDPCDECPALNLQRIVGFNGSVKNGLHLIEGILLYLINQLTSFNSRQTDRRQVSDTFDDVSTWSLVHYRVHGSKREQTAFLPRTFESCFRHRGFTLWQVPCVWSSHLHGIQGNHQCLHARR